MPRQERDTSRCTLRSWARLSGIAATIFEHRCLNMSFTEHVPRFEDHLTEWFNSGEHCRCHQGPQLDTQLDLSFCLTPLWHHSFITLHANLDLLEHAIGRDGSYISDAALDYVRSWVASPASKRCLLHALLIQNLSLSTTLNSAVALHTPRILFAAALCWQCYIAYSPWLSSYIARDASSSEKELSEYLMELPEVRLLGQNRDHSGCAQNMPKVEDTVSELWNILRSTPAEMNVRTVCVLESTLRRLPTGGISQRFADIIQACILKGK